MSASIIIIRDAKADRDRRRSLRYALAIRTRIGHERGLQRRSGALLAAQARRAESLILSGGLEALADSLERDRPGLARLISARTLVAGRDSIRALRSLVEKDLGPADELLQDFVAQLGLAKSKSVTKTTIELARQALQEGAAEGLPEREIARAVASTLSSSVAFRAVTIARTEIGTASAWADQAYAEHSGLTLVKVWLTAQDGGPRHPSDPELHGQERELSEPFDVRGAAMMHPLDPAGPAEEVINCRCAAGYDPV